MRFYLLRPYLDFWGRLLGHFQGAGRWARATHFARCSVEPSRYTASGQPSSIASSASDGLSPPSPSCHKLPTLSQVPSRLCPWTRESSFSSTTKTALAPSLLFVAPHSTLKHSPTGLVLEPTHTCPILLSCLAFALARRSPLPFPSSQWPAVVYGRPPVHTLAHRQTRPAQPTATAIHRQQHQDNPLLTAHSITTPSQPGQTNTLGSESVTSKLLQLLRVLPRPKTGQQHHECPTLLLPGPCTSIPLPEFTLALQRVASNRCCKRRCIVWPHTVSFPFPLP